jgi:hypothetical protein
MGIGLATGWPDTPSGGPLQQGRRQSSTKPPVGNPTGGFVFSTAHKANRTYFEDRTMISYRTYQTYYRSSDWRFSRFANALIPLLRTPR